MKADDLARFAAGENDEGPPPPPNSDIPDSGLSEDDAVAKDRTYSPASETETERKQEDPLPDTIDDDIDKDDIRVVPGTGGPDDVGDVDVDPADLNMPGRS
jgi:hypothetical protein